MHRLDSSSNNFFLFADAETAVLSRNIARDRGTKHLTVELFVRVVVSKHLENELCKKKSFD